MKNKTKILYVWEHDVSLGDALTNFHAHLSIVKDRNPLSIIYVISHPRTYNTGVLNLLIDKGLIDFVYPFQISKLNDELNGHFKNLLINLNIDIIIHNKHTEYESVKLLQDEFKNSIHLQTNDSNLKT